MQERFESNLWMIPKIELTFEKMKVVCLWAGWNVILSAGRLLVS